MNHSRIKVLLDTQILAYLVDKTYPSLTLFIDKISKSEFIDLECSRFAIFEFIGIRKTEHYLRCLIEQTQENGGKVNFSSALKYKNDFNSEVKYIDVYEKIKSLVENELNTIYDDFGIAYENINIHNKIWKPHQDLVLSSRISKEDSLLLISSIYPNEFDYEDYSILLTNDTQFSDAFNEPNNGTLFETIFKEHGLTKPIVFNLRKCKLEIGVPINFTSSNTPDTIIEFANNFIFEHFKNKNFKLLLGEVISCSCSAKLKKQILCFILNDEQILNENIYITIMSKDLYIYNHPLKLNDFMSWGENLTFPYKSNTDVKSKQISIKLENLEGGDLDQSVMQKISKPGSLIFIHADSIG